MTFRPTASKPTRRRARQIDSRRALYMNIAFGLASVAAIALLGGVLFGNWYTDHGVAIASVNGTAISKDAVRQRAALDLARYNRQIQTLQTLRNQTRITSGEYSGLTSTMTTNSVVATLYQNAENEIIAEMTLQQYADSHGISVSDAQVDAQITKDATTPELRHVKVIGVDPKPTPPAANATAAEETAAQAQAQAYLDSIKTSGKKWDDVATASNADNVGPSGTTGDLGMLNADNTTLDPELITDIFSLAKVGDITPVVKCQDGVWRFATVTVILPPSTDTGWRDAIGNGDSYRGVAHAEALKTAVQASIEAKYVTAPTVQRHVLEIAMGPGYGQAGDGPEVKVKYMIFSPNHDATQASSLPLTDAAWTEAANRATAAYTALQADPTQFDKLARDTKNNDDTNFASAGGDVPWLPESVWKGDASSGAGLGMTTVDTAIFSPTIKPGIQTPIREPAMGYVLIDFEGTRPAPLQRFADVELSVAAGTDFKSLVTQYSEATDAPDGGDMQWVSPYMLSDELLSAIFQAPVGGTSRVVQNTNGFWIFKVLSEETRTPDAAQQAKLKRVVFDHWLSDLTANTNVWTDAAGLTGITPTPTP
jgi:hypothetical protein